MTETPSLEASMTFRARARLLGTVLTLAGFAVAVLTASAVTELARGRVDAGLELLVASLAARWFVNLANNEFSDFSSRVIRHHWRRQLSHHWRSPLREGERGRGDLALAVERVSHAPALELLGTSARVAALGLVIVFWSAGWLPTLIVVALLLLAIPLYQRSGNRSSTLVGEFHQRRALLESRQLELLHHATELRALGAVAYGADEIAAISDSEHTIALRAIRVALESSLVTEFLSGVSIGLVAMVVGFALLGGRITLLHALIAVLVTNELFGHIRRYGVEFHRREDADLSLELLNSRTPLLAAPARSVLLLAEDLITEASAHAVSLRIAPSSRFLITGPSGSGKTTLLHTLVGWREAVSGHVQRSGEPLGYVSVESTLFSGSIWDNVTLGVDFDTDVVRRLLVRLGLDSSRFMDLSASLLHDGRGLSEGERVRLVLVRALLAEPALLVLDDVAGVLDSDSRNRVAAVLESLPSLAVLEATVDTPILGNAADQLEIRP